MRHERAMHVLAQHLQRGGGTGGRALEKLCRAHEDLEADLRELARERAEARVAPPCVPSDGANAGGRQRTESRYVLLGEVARGATAVVLRVWDTVLERPLALKLLEPSDDERSADEARAEKERFLAEARIAGRLQHPGVVPIHDLGTDARGRLYFTMPLCEGRPFEEAFELARSHSEGWTTGRALLAILRVCEVVAYAHARGVIHRDLKPSNLIAGTYGEVVVVDWGLAKVLEARAREGANEAPKPDAGTADASRASASSNGSVSGLLDGTLDGTVAGTPPWMAPEQALGRVAEVSYLSDVYAIGALLYRLLAGRAPYAPREGSESPERLLDLIRRGPPTPLGLAAPDAPRELVAIGEKAMARKPAERYASVDELASALRAYFEERLGAVVLP